MALNKIIEDKETGIELSYHKLLNIAFYGAGIQITVGSYPSEAARQADKQPLVRDFFVNDKNDWILTEHYELLKRLDIFEGSVDV